MAALGVSLAVGSVLLMACSSTDARSATTTTAAASHLEGDPCPFVPPDSTATINGQPLRDALLVMGTQCTLATTHAGRPVAFAVSLSSTGIDDASAPTIPPDGSGTEHGSVTTVPSKSGTVYLVELEGDPETTRSLYSSRNGFAANVTVAEPGAPADAFDISGATAAIDELLDNASR